MATMILIDRRLYVGIIWEKKNTVPANAVKTVAVSYRRANYPAGF